MIPIESCYQPSKKRQDRLQDLFPLALSVQHSMNNNKSQARRSERRRNKENSQIKKEGTSIATRMAECAATLLVYPRRNCQNFNG